MFTVLMSDETCVQVCLCMCVCAGVSVQVCLCMCICICAWICHRGAILQRFCMGWTWQQWALGLQRVVTFHHSCMNCSLDFPADCTTLKIPLLWSYVAPLHNCCLDAGSKWGFKFLLWQFVIGSRCLLYVCMQQARWCLYNVTLWCMCIMSVQCNIVVHVHNVCTM
jgi:hypothetical protein